MTSHPSLPTNFLVLALKAPHPSKPILAGHTGEVGHSSCAGHPVSPKVIYEWVEHTSLSCALSTRAPSTEVEAPRNRMLRLESAAGKLGGQAMTSLLLSQQQREKTATLLVLSPPPSLAEREDLTVPFVLGPLPHQAVVQPECGVGSVVPECGPVPNPLQS